MENNWKPAQVILVEDHHLVGQPGTGVLLKPDLYDYDFYTDKERRHLVSPEGRKICHDALSGLAGLGNQFLITISLGVDPGKKVIFYTKRTWASIDIAAGSHVLTFSHHTKKENHAFYSIGQWVELEENDTTKLVEWDSKEWTKFFRKRIQDRANFLVNKANKLREEAAGFDKSSLEILNKLLM